MKNFRQIVTILFSAYLLGLMVLPCSESHAQGASVIKSASQDHDGHDHDHDMELCTPFCVCGSCVTAIVISPPIDFVIYNPENHCIRDNSNFYQSIKSDFHGSIWQPPQLV